LSIDVERDGAIATVTVNRPEALNAIDLEHAESLRDGLEELAGDEATRVVILTGAGEKAFIAGADIKYMQGLGTLEARRWGEIGHACGQLLETMPKPTMAAIKAMRSAAGSSSRSRATCASRRRPPSSASRRSTSGSSPAGAGASGSRARPRSASRRQ
jgi:enoyl-CoA hydratase/carnithine racemase